MARHLILVAASVVAGLIQLAFVTPATADKRVALVIGNSNYQHAGVLPNPRNDAAAIGDLFKRAGFTVIVAIDVGNLEFKRKIRDFTVEARNADIATVFYAGHGIELRNVNYLIPVDAKLQSDIDAPDEAVTLDRVLDAFELVKGLRLIILDACRDNPFQKNMQRTFATRSGAKGLAEVRPSGNDVLIAYAAKGGSTAADGSGTNSPFTTALVKHLSEPGLEVQFAFRKIRDTVLESTGGRQEPFVYASLGGKEFALVPRAIEPAKPVVAPVADVERQYQQALQVGSKDAWDAFLSVHKIGFYAELARAQRKKFEQASLGPVIVPPKPVQPGSDPELVWDRLKDSTDIAAIREFIERFPASRLSPLARQRLQLLETAARERDAKTRRDAEEQRKAAEAQKAAEEADRRRKAAADAEQRRKEKEAAEAEQRRQALEAAEAERKRKGVSEPASEPDRKEAEDAARQRQAAEAERRRKAAVEAERRRKEAAEAQRRSKEAEAERRRKTVSTKPVTPQVRRPPAAPQSKQFVAPQRGGGGGGGSIGVMHGL